MIAAVVGSLLIALALPAPAARGASPAAVVAVAGEAQTQVFTVPGSTVPQTPQRDGQQPAKPGTATLRGRVFAADSGQPLRKAQIRITSVGAGVTGQLPENLLATTDASGAYEFTALRAGRYNLNAQKGSFIGMSYGQQRPFEPGKPLEILDGQTIGKVDFSLPRGGIITGRILDEFSEPISDVQVVAMRSQNAGGTRRLVQAGRTGLTNDIGEFRLFALPAGDYTLQAQAPPAAPGSDPEYASAEVTVQGTDVTGVQIVGTKPSTIAGRVMITSGDPQALKPSTLRISLFPAPGPGGNTIIIGPVPQPVAVNDDWSFQARARSGTMRVQTQGLQPPWNVKAVRYRGIDVTDSGLDVKPDEDLSEIEIELTNRTTDISGIVANSRGEPMNDYWTVLFARDP